MSNEFEDINKTASENFDTMMKKLDEYLGLAFEFMNGEGDCQIILAELQQNLNKIHNRDKLQ